DPRLRRLFESVDICQSVFASFFVRAALGQYELETPAQLLRLLATIARNKLASQARRESAGRRDRGRVAADVGVENCPPPRESPSRQVAAKELGRRGLVMRTDAKPGGTGFGDTTFGSVRSMA